MSRWSRLKRESVAGDSVASNSIAGNSDASNAALPASEQSSADRARQKTRTAGEKPDANPLPELPSLETLGPDSDFQAFMDPRVDDAVRRAALKTLFRDPTFNITDGLDVYAEDYTKLEKLTPAMVAALRYAQRTLFGEQDQSERTSATTDQAGNGGEGGAGDSEPRGGSGPTDTDVAEHVHGEDREDDQAGDTARLTNSNRPAHCESEVKQSESDRSGNRKS